MARMGRLVLAILIAVVSFLPSYSAFRHSDWSSPNGMAKGWARGPVWYIMTNNEYRDYSRLRSDPTRQAFIKRFWSLRDPLPDTGENELEREFWDRVQVADGHFGQEVKPGWKTERGKVFIMLGPPDNFDHDHILSDTWGARRWVYDLGTMPTAMRQVLQDSLGIPTERRFVKVRVRAESEGMRSVAGAMPAQSSVLRPTDFLPLAETLVRRIPGPDALRQLGQVMRVPEVMERNKSHVDVTTVFSLVPVQARVDFRSDEGTHSDRTTVAVTLGVTREDLRKAGVAEPRAESSMLTGHLTSIDDEKQSIPLNGIFSPDPSPDVPSDHVFQAICEVPPGRYLLDVSYQDTGQHIMGSLRDIIDVPAFVSQGLGVSGLILASRLEKLERSQGEPTPRDEPFMIGKYRVIPRTNQVYTSEGSLTIFYRVTGEMRDTEGDARLDLAYQFYLFDSGTWLPVGAPIAVEGQDDGAQAWSVPLAGMPAGRYRLEVTVTDHLADATSIRGIFFEIAPQPQPQQPLNP